MLDVCIGLGDSQPTELGPNKIIYITLDPSVALGDNRDGTSLSTLVPPALPSSSSACFVNPEVEFTEDSNLLSNPSTPTSSRVSNKGKLNFVTFKLVKNVLMTTI